MTKWSTCPHKFIQRFSELIQLLLLLALAPTSVFALTIETGKCYSIDGPANVRDTPGGNVVSSLPDGKIVRVKQAQDSNWLLIAYTAAYNRSICPPSEDTDIIMKWTHRDNLLPFPEILDRLVQSGRVLIANQLVNKYDDTMKNLLGEELTIENNDYELLGTPINTFKVMVYCLDGTKSSNQILSVSYEYGGDAGLYLAKINTKRKVHRTDCIFVNGVIKDMGESGRKLKEVKNWNVCSKNDGKYSVCNTSKGDLNKDGFAEVIMTNETSGAPSKVAWWLYSANSQGSLQLLGNIGSRWRP